MLSSERELSTSNEDESYFDEFKAEIEVNGFMGNIQHSLQEKIEFARQYRKNEIYQKTKSAIMNGNSINQSDLWCYLWITDDNPQALPQQYKDMVVMWYDHEMNCVYNTLCNFFLWETQTDLERKSFHFKHLYERFAASAGNRFYMNLIPIEAFDNEQSLAAALDRLTTRAWAKRGKDYSDYLMLMAWTIVHV